MQAGLRLPRARAATAPGDRATAEADRPAAAARDGLPAASSSGGGSGGSGGGGGGGGGPLISESVRARAAARRREQLTYRAAAVAASLGIGALAVGATYYRFASHADGEFPWLDAACTLALIAGGAVGMELWARFAHKSLWHDFRPGWALHKSHHEPRTGPFEANDVYAVVNAVPAIALCSYGFLNATLPGALCFGAGLGITLFGWAYLFTHDGLVHKRFPTGPIANHPYMLRVVAAHKLHHTEKYGGVPFGLFFGPQELEAIGAGPELDRLVAEMEEQRGAKAGANGSQSP
ncbi:beta-carotene hydroxylase [Raphidocelis subcapitata]|uniref:beta-carotene 3-hydroxylase n=1 Tax=Raphidocelis subcapitata TaxID=307507 RepID=A0A2V0PHN4_9CHLO|nr:beta-carotene hydroxylase [Raphidocelis subcapitata]|eukprot:GBF99089.1 beta-carotene hydroxylase [Raphidocelis subcapitata]